MLVKVRETVLNFKSRRKQGISIPSSALDDYMLHLGTVIIMDGAGKVL